MDYKAEYERLLEALVVLVDTDPSIHGKCPYCSEYVHTPDCEWLVAWDLVRQYRKAENDEMS